MRDQNHNNGSDYAAWLDAYGQKMNGKTPGQVPPQGSRRVSSYDDIRSDVRGYANSDKYRRENTISSPCLLYTSRCV